MCTKQEWTQRIQTLAQQERTVHPCRIRAIKKMETDMPDDTTKTGRDRKFISLEQDYEIRVWAMSLGCTENQLREAVKAVGNSADKVREYLKT